MFWGRRRLPKLFRLRTWLKILAGCAVMVAVIRGVLIWQNHKMMDELRAQGIPVTLEELNTWYASVPDEQNAANEYLQAIELEKDFPQGHYDLLPFFGLLEWEYGTPLSPETKSAIKNVVTLNKDALEKVHTATEKPLCRFPIDLTAGYDVNLQHLSHMRQFARLLAVESLDAFEDDDRPRAISDVIAQLKLITALENEPTNISQLVRIACIGIFTNTLGNALNHGACSEEELAGLASAMKNAYSRDAIARTLAWEMCELLDALYGSFTSPHLISTFQGWNYWYRVQSKLGFEPIDPMVAPVPQDTFSGTIAFRDRVSKLAAAEWSALGFRDYNVRDLLIAYREAFALSKEPLPAGMDQLCTFMSQRRLAPHSFPFEIMFFSPAVPRSVYSIVAGEAELRVCETALAVERFRNTNNRLPEQLQELVPQFLSAVPEDSFDGAPLRYHLRDPGYSIYSVNKDRQDDGGASIEEVRRKQSPPNCDLSLHVRR